MKIKRIKIILAIAFWLVTVSAFSDPHPPRPGGFPGNGHGPPWSQPGLPIDGGVSFLLIIGAAFGVYAIRKNKPD